MIKETELNKILFESNNTTRIYPSDPCTHHLFEDQVEHHPDANALVWGQHSLSYTVLNQRANQLARYLQKLGVGMETLVGIALERSLEMVMSLLAVFKAGGAYVPLDPTYPQARLAWMLEDAKIFVLLTQAHLKDRLLTSSQTIFLDLQWTEIAKESSENLDCSVCPEHLAYVIYTSGSTGKPKGVMVEHRGVSNLVRAQIQSFDVQSSSRILQFASLSFDASFWEIMMALGSGACLCLAPWESLLPGPPLLYFLRRQAITHVTLPPSALALLPKEDIPSLKCLIVAGETCPVELAAYWKTHCRFFNAYGPTESTVCATVAEIHDLVQERLPIGGPLPNMQVYILDEKLLPVPIGMTGELYIGGVGLARGYLNRPELTTEKFIPNPFIPHTRIYKTGDLARWLSDGRIEFLGRVDEQVKIRGFRIELGEIETILAQHPAVQQCVVVLKEDQQADQHVVAYLIPWQKNVQEHLTHQQSISEQVYSQAHEFQEPTFNLSGWNSSYTGQAISEDEMREWIEQTVAQIMAFNPCEVLEIGCGMGLLLSRIAPQCQRYVGLDFSHQAVEHIKKMQQVTQGLEQVTVLQRSAEDLTDFDPHTFDTVIINSVIQAFPHVDYLLQVLKGACTLVKPGGRVVVGDVRHFGLLEAYHTSVQVYQASDQTSCAKLRQRIHQCLSQEEELLLDPQFFLALQHHIPEITHVQVQPKRGRYHNELTQFRYEAILHLGMSVQPISIMEWINGNDYSLADIHHLLRHTQAKILGIRNIPNARLHTERCTRAWLQTANSQDKVVQLRSLLAQESPTGIEPDDLWNLSQDIPYHVELSGLNTHPEGHYDMVLISHTLPWQPALFVEKLPLPLLKKYVHTPSLNGSLIPQFRDFLKTKLPEYMLPSAFVILETWPLTPNGKIDRQTLAQLPLEVGISEKPLAAPRNALEAILAEIWAETLGIEHIGIDDDFFEWGGNSLKAMVLFNRLQKQFHQTFQLRDLFEAPTIAEFVTYIGTFSLNSEDHFPQPNSTLLFPSWTQEKTYYAIKGSSEQADSVHNIPYGFRITGPLNIPILQESFNEIARRHEILRTTLQEINGTLVQMISPEASIHFSTLTLRGGTEQDIERFIQEEIHRPFHLTTDHVLRVTVLQLGEDSCILLLCMYGIISDNWSLGILLKELSILYAAFLSQQTSPLPPLPIQYKDYAQWQRQLPAQELLETKLNYWKHWFNQGTPPVLKFPTDKTLPATQTFHSGIQTCQFSPGVVQKLHILSQQTDTTLFMVLLAAYAVFLSHHTACQDIVIGAPFANRNRWQFESLIGAIINMLTLRIDVHGNLDFIELLSQVRQIVLDALTYQDFPFEQLIKILPWESPSTLPVPHAHLSFFKESPTEPLKLPGLTSTFLNIEGVLARDIFLVVWETPQGNTLQGWWQYKKDLFEANTIAKLANDFEKLLESIVAHPKQPLNILLQHSLNLIG